MKLMFKCLTQRCMNLVLKMPVFKREFLRPLPMHIYLLKTLQVSSTRDGHLLTML